MTGPRDVWHLFECSNPRCASKGSPSDPASGVVVQVRLPAGMDLGSVSCPVCWARCSPDGHVGATESGHFPAREPGLTETEARLASLVRAVYGALNDGGLPWALSDTCKLLMDELGPERFNAWARLPPYKEGT